MAQRQYQQLNAGGDKGRSTRGGWRVLCAVYADEMSSRPELGYSVGAYLSQEPGPKDEFGVNPENWNRLNRAKMQADLLLREQEFYGGCLKHRSFTLGRS